MAKIHPGATLTPHFQDFLPGWVARQPWYRGSGTPTLTPVGYFRFEGPLGQVGIETHLHTDGTTLYQIPMTYRDAPLGPTEPLITTAEHSVLGTRWIYDAVVDPVWINELLGLIQTNGVSDPSAKRGVGPAEARGRSLTSTTLTPDTVMIDLRRAITPDQLADHPGVLGVVTGTWQPAGEPSVSGTLAVVTQA